ncbi:MAG TPA: hypothetical protein VIJ79_11080 [Acidobacteriaceae bacterium]
MTTMFEPFFGFPQSAVRLGKLKSISGFASKLYIGLCHEFERYSTRERIFTVSQLQALVGGSRNSHAKARIQLITAGLVQAEPYGTEGFIFQLCDPETGAPWPLPPRERVVLPRKGKPVAVATQDVSKSAAFRKPPKIDSAGTSFAYGFNVSAPVERPFAAPQSNHRETVTPLRWDEIGK